MAKTTQDCGFLVIDGAIPTADPDISGNGVVLAFVISAYLTFLTALLAYLFGLVDGNLLSPVDTKIFRIRPYDPTKHPKIYLAVRKAVLALGDQQIVTGIAIMGAGFEGLRTGKISVYHFQIVLYLAWMSSSVHLSALTLLGDFLNKHKGLMVWRLSGMLVLLVLLLVGIVPTLSNDWGIVQYQPNIFPPGHIGWAIPAHCFWGHLWGDGVSPDAVLGFFIVVVSYLWKVGALFGSARRDYNRWVRYPVENHILAILKLPARNFVRRGGRLWLWIYRLLLCISLPIFAVMEVTATFAASLWLSALGLVFGTLQVEIPRSQLLPFVGEQEASWGFGQLVPLILLVQPLGAVSEHIWTAKDDDDESMYTPSEPALESESTVTPLDQHSDSLLHFMAYQENGSGMPIEEREIMKSIFFDSKLFATLVWIVQVALLFTFTITFWFDAETIGWTRTHWWGGILAVIGGMVVIGMLTTLICSPFSRLGRSTLESQKRQGGGETRTAVKASKATSS